MNHHESSRVIMTDDEPWWFIMSHLDLWWEIMTYH